MIKFVATKFNDDYLFTSAFYPPPTFITVTGLSVLFYLEFVIPIGRLLSPKHGE